MAVSALELETKELLRARAEVARLKVAQSIVDEQADDENLWFKSVYITEDILQKALRRLHEAIEGKSSVDCAKAALSPPGGGTI